MAARVEFTDAWGEVCQVRPGTMGRLRVGRVDGDGMLLEAGHALKLAHVLIGWALGREFGPFMANDGDGFHVVEEEE